MKALGDKGWSKASLPQALTIDEAADREFDHVILDEVDCWAGEGEGWFVDQQRCAVFYARGRKAQWIVSGPVS